MPSMTASKYSCRSLNAATPGASASATGCRGAPPNTAPISLRHHASLSRATPGSVTSSTTSSTSRQNAYNAMIARRRSGGRKRKL